MSSVPYLTFTIVIPTFYTYDVYYIERRNTFGQINYQVTAAAAAGAAAASITS